MKDIKHDWWNVIKYLFQVDSHIKTVNFEVSPRNEATPMYYLRTPEGTEIFWSWNFVPDLSFFV